MNLFTKKVSGVKLVVQKSSRQVQTTDSQLSTNRRYTTELNDDIFDKYTKLTGHRKINKTFSKRIFFAETENPKMIPGMVLWWTLGQTNSSFYFTIAHKYKCTKRCTMMRDSCDKLTRKSWQNVSLRASCAGIM